MTLEVERLSPVDSESTEVAEETGGDVDLPQGEAWSVIEPDHIIDHVKATDRKMGALTFLRRVATFRSVTGEELKSGLDEVGLSEHEIPGHFWADMKSHKKTIAITGAALLIAAGTGVRLQRNCTQRKKMGQKA